MNNTYYYSFRCWNDYPSFVKGLENIIQELMEKCPRIYLYKTREAAQAAVSTPLADNEFTNILTFTFSKGINVTISLDFHYATFYEIEEENFVVYNNGNWEHFKFQE